ncbi:MAG TPA: hypothetical protein VGJ04_00200, partial [Pirellulales bacterium]
AAPDRAAGDTFTLEHLQAQPAPEGPDSDLVRIEFHREVFRWAADQIRKEFRPLTWNSFWLTAVEQQPIEEVAQRLGISAGAIYASRSRIMRRLKEKVSEFDADEGN